MPKTYRIIIEEVFSTEPTEPVAPGGQKPVPLERSVDVFTQRVNDLDLPSLIMKINTPVRKQRTDTGKKRSPKGTPSNQSLPGLPAE